MSEPTVTERAIQYVAEASWRGDGWVADDFEAKGSTYVWGAKQMITALLARPDLLVDLAIEAGGLEQVGWFDEGELPDHKFVEMDYDGADDPHCDAVYRRTPTEENDGD